MSSSYKLDDSTIGLFAQIIQLALLTGTDIVDNFRTVHLTLDESGRLIPDPAFLDQFQENIQKLVAQAESIEPGSTEDEINA